MCRTAKLTVGVNTYFSGANAHSCRRSPRVLDTFYSCFSGLYDNRIPNTTVYLALRGSDRALSGPLVVYAIYAKHTRGRSPQFHEQRPSPRSFIIAALSLRPHCRHVSRVVRPKPPPRTACLKSSPYFRAAKIFLHSGWAKTEFSKAKKSSSTCVV